MVRVIISNRILVEEDCLRLIKRYTMLPLVLATLILVPFESNVTHTYIVNKMLFTVNIYGRMTRIRFGELASRNLAPLVYARHGRELVGWPAFAKGYGEVS